MCQSTVEDSLIINTDSGGNRGASPTELLKKDMEDELSLLKRSSVKSNTGELDDVLNDEMSQVQDDITFDQNSPELPTIQVTSDVIMANDAFQHVVGCFDKLQTTLGQAGILPEDFAVEVGFVQELQNTQGFYFSCQKTLPEELAELLVDIFHPFPYILLPYSERIAGDGETITTEAPSVPCNVLGDADKGKQPAVSFRGSGCGDEGLPGDGEGNGEDEGEGEGRGGDRGEGSSGGGGLDGGSKPGGGEEDQKNQLSGDFESIVKFEDAQGDMQTIKMRANVVTRVNIILLFMDVLSYEF